ncbi:YceI family protein [Nonomuraea fuscirosea]|uniref:YceI family protein n=1 Tax=Nonomuraea fuscirosea TaxID=1291556 RepID=UPI00344AA5B8
MPAPASRSRSSWSVSRRLARPNARQVRCSSSVSHRRPVRVHRARALDAAGVDTGNPQRDGHLRTGDFLDAAAYPHITFTSTAVRNP